MESKRRASLHSCPASSHTCRSLVVFAPIINSLPSLTAAVAAAVADAGTEPSDVDLAALEAATGLCGRPCARGMTVAGFNGQFHDAPVANFDYPHRAGVMLEAG